LNATQCPLDELLEAADFVSLHCPSSAQTLHLIDERRLRLMPSTAILVNTARGEVVDEAALITALERGDIAAAGLDVYEQEPQVPQALLDCPNLVALPHLGSATQETRNAMGMRAVANLRAYFSGETAPDLLT
jgi:lactate dehydrogenase-like 2-hydroxyacid dehydrogenase